MKASTPCPVVLQIQLVGRRCFEMREVWDTPLPMPEWDPSYVSW